MRHLTAVPVAVLSLLLGSGCYSGVSGSDEDAGGDGSSGDDGDGDGSGSADDDADGGIDDGANPDELPAPNTRFYRLTHQQWENTVRDLLGLADITGFSSEFRLDAKEAGYIFDNNVQATEVDSALWGGYQRAATSVAELAVVTDPTIMAGLISSPGDAETFVREFGRRAFRRPLTDDEVSVYVAGFSQANDFYTDSTGFDAGVRLTIESMLQSPHFLYRIEDSEEESGGVIPLDHFEVAARMSYFLWDTMPDDELLDAAEADMLGDHDSIAEQAARMLDDPRAVDAIQSFHFSYHDVDKFTHADPNPAVYPDAPEMLGELAQQEHEAFIRDVIFEQSGTYTDMLTSTRTFVNAETAPLYGLDPAGYGEEFVAADLDASQRRGIFTQLGFLVGNATSVEPDPIHRGVYLARRVSCTQIPAPPAMVPMLPAVDGQTNREAIEDLTQQDGSDCAGCHATVINPWGFPFENYDSTGAWRDTDNGFPVDPATTVTLDGEQLPVTNAVELIDSMATSYAVHACYSNFWVQFANGRPQAIEDLPLVTRLAGLSMGDTSVKDVLVELVTSRPFRSRSVEEVE